MSEQTWRERRDEDLERISDEAHRLLVDRTIIHATAAPHDDSCDGRNVIRLTLDDRTVVDLVGGYGGYSGHSCDEYVEYISIHEMPTPPQPERDAAGGAS